jgi:hypothetical protein
MGGMRIAGQLEQAFQSYRMMFKEFTKKKRFPITIILRRKQNAKQDTETLFLEGEGSLFSALSTKHSLRNLFFTLDSNLRRC